MPYEPKPGEICIFENEKAGHENAPDHRGYFVAHRDIKAGEKIAIALWVGKPGSVRTFGGTIAERPNSGADAAEVPTDLFGNPLQE
ncbi:hypothetical protein [Rhizobium sp. IBUN]|uniref:hypothetical protein n=1 Tax=Rhizobium sp. IBUN TaxID=1042326 RepID=UPI00040682D4|nr:hypothetical protein [Rhizobium sp. IBUN]